MKKINTNNNSDVNQQISEEKVIDVLKTCYDPEIPVNIYDLGLIYKVEISDSSMIEVEMTLTTPACPVADQLVADVEHKLNDLEGITEAKVSLVFEPPWDKDMMSEAAKLELGFI